MEQLIFGYNKNELIGKRRVSFSPENSSSKCCKLALIASLLKGVHNGKTIFINKKGDKINAKLVSPTYSKGPNKLQTDIVVIEVIDENIEV